MKAIKIVVICTVIACMTGCMALNRIEMSVSRNTTIGKELVDLNEAKEKGIISQKEYEKAKRKLLESAVFVNVKLQK